MTIVEFLTCYKNETLPGFLAGGVLYFYGSTYSFIVFHSLLSCIRRQSIDIVTLNDDACSLGEIQQRLFSLHLGDPYLLWLGDIDRLEVKLSTSVVTLAQNYEGPHWLSFFSTKIKQKNVGHVQAKKWYIEVPDRLNRQECYEIVKALSPYQTEQSELKKIIYRWYDDKKIIPFETVCRTVSYLLLLQKDSDVYVQKWKNYLMPEEKSLYTLASYLFSKNCKDFFSWWRLLSVDYSDQFWIGFWSDQFFRAYWFKVYQGQQEQAMAKKIAFKLPFSFLNKDYKLSSVQECALMHTKLYELDWSLKNGCTIGFESLFLNFMLNRLTTDKDQFLRH